MRIAKLTGHLEYVPHIHTLVLGGGNNNGGGQSQRQRALDALRALGVQGGQLERLCAKLQEVLVQDTCTADKMWRRRANEVACSRVCRG